MSNTAKPQHPQHLNYPPVSANYQSDEIDLRELFKALWQGKLIIVVTTIVFAVGAIFYALNSQQWWSSKAIIAAPQIQEFSAYQKQVKQYQPIFDVYQEDGTVLVSQELNSLISPNSLLQQYIDAFNSNQNKRQFLETSIEFQMFKKANSEGEQNDSKAEGAQYQAWFSKISAKKKDLFYDLSFQSTSQSSSYALLKHYSELIGAKTRKDALSNLQAIVESKRNELAQQKRMLTDQALNRLSVEIERTKYALVIAKAAGVDKPVQTNNNQEIFAIDLGSKALAAKVESLESVKNLSVIEPRLQQIDAKLKMLDGLVVDSNIKFEPVRFIEGVQEPITRDKPKRALIVVLGTMLGGMLGVAIVLIRFAFRREDETEK
ncbi:LPS O-antigen chain length determinant protein WzzB [Vibrio scophthalmi]|uniref:Chain length determinant protein n=1 Tax=Vibrio scophthalmi LMG 19158 TaxID=870967 RepID=F9RKG4_9VIBR|nr:LPS chain length-determining protein [Vibrio scophthalmi]EGU39793.1 chain length determinant protein [Vibrio scophthalmi LMG 19158]